MVREHIPTAYEMAVGIDITHEKVRFWWNRFGPLFARSIRKRRVNSKRYSNWAWHLDEFFVRINGVRHYLWRAIYHEGEVLEAFGTKRRDRNAALKFLRKTKKRYGAPDLVVTDKLPSYKVAFRDLGMSGRQANRRWRSNRAENSHQPLRRREKIMTRFRSMRSLQKFVATQSSIHNHFKLERHLYSRSEFKKSRAAALAEWHQHVA